MSAPFAVRTSPYFDRLLTRLARRHPDLPEVFARAVDILSADPCSRSGAHAIRKLHGIPAGEGRNGACYKCENSGGTSGCS